MTALGGLQPHQKRALCRPVPTRGNDHPGCLPRQRFRQLLHPCCRQGLPWFCFDSHQIRNPLQPGQLTLRIGPGRRHDFISRFLPAEPPRHHQLDFPVADRPSSRASPPFLPLPKLSHLLSAFQADVNLMATYKGKFWSGLGYSSGDAVVVLLGANLGKHLRVGYSYDYNLSGLSRFNDGSHEIFVGYDLTIKLPTRPLLIIRSPRNM